MKKKLLLIGTVLIVMCSVCGCSEKEADKKKETEASTEAATVEDVEDADEEEESRVVENVVEPEEEEESEEVVKTGKAVIDIPEGFKEYLPPSGIYVTSKYPKDGSNIYILTTPLYGEFPNEKEYKAKINDSISSQVGRKVEIELEEYGETTVDGCDALRAVYTYTYDDMKFKRLEYTVNTDITTVIAYTQMDDADWMDAFEESAMSMYVE